VGGLPAGKGREERVGESLGTRNVRVGVGGDAGRVVAEGGEGGVELGADLGGRSMGRSRSGDVECRTVSVVGFAEIGNEDGAAEELLGLVVAVAGDGVESGFGLLPFDFIGEFGEAEGVWEDEGEEGLGFGGVGVLVFGELAPAGEPVEACAPGGVDGAVAATGGEGVGLVGSLGGDGGVELGVRQREASLGALDRGRELFERSRRLPRGTSSVRRR
jgi:hypothetical protein